MRIWAGMALAALASFMAVNTAEADTSPPTLQGAQQLVIAHIGGRYQAGTSLSRTSAGAAIITVTATYQWPGAYFEGAFKGDEVTVRLKDGVNILKIFIDGNLHDTLNKPGEIIKTYKGLGEGQHIIRIERATEDQSATSTFEGFFAPAGPMLAIKPRARQIEFIGDSYTVGYGNTSPKPSCTRDEVWATTDTTQAFGPLTAKHYDADYQINAISGRGVVRNYGGFIADTLPQAYPYVLFDKQTKYDDPDWKPQIIVVGLGTNDFTTPLHDGEKWKTRDDLHKDYEATYVKFVQELRANNPHAWFILMATDQVDGEIQSEVNKVIAALQAAGESRIAFLPMNGLSFGGCDHHPTVADDKKVSDELIAFIDQHPDIWQGQ